MRPPWAGLGLGLAATQHNQPAAGAATRPAAAAQAQVAAAAGPGPACRPAAAPALAQALCGAGPRGASRCRLRPRLWPCPRAALKPPSALPGAQPPRQGQLDPAVPRCARCCRQPAAAVAQRMLRAVLGWGGPYNGIGAPRAHGLTPTCMPAQEERSAGRRQGRPRSASVQALRHERRAFETRRPAPAAAPCACRLRSTHCRSQQRPRWSRRRCTSGCKQGHVRWRSRA
jgi:hypothetical protein